MATLFQNVMKKHLLKYLRSSATPKQLISRELTTSQNITVNLLKNNNKKEFFKAAREQKGT